MISILFYLHAALAFDLREQFRVLPPTVDNFDYGMVQTLGTWSEMVGAAFLIYDLTDEELDDFSRMIRRAEFVEKEIPSKSAEKKIVTEARDTLSAEVEAGLNKKFETERAIRRGGTWIVAGAIALDGVLRYSLLLSSRDPGVSPVGTLVRKGVSEAGTALFGDAKTRGEGQ